MLIIPQCRFCNADKTTCPIKQDLKKKLQKARITEPLRYKCVKWREYALYKPGDTIRFYFLELNPEGGMEESGEYLQGVIESISKVKPVYLVKIDQENRNKIDPEYAKYDKYVHDYYGEDGFYLLPVREQYILNKII